MNDQNNKAQAKHLTKDDFDQVLKAAGDKPVMVDFFADWCGPCQIAAPIIDELSDEYADKAEVYKLDVDENQEISQRYGVMSIPTVIVFKKGEPVDKLVGFPGKQGYVQLLEKAASKA